MDIVYPAILSVPEKDQALLGRKKVLSLSRLARKALAVSARKKGLILTCLTKDKQGVPKPFNGKHWSLTHKDEYVGGVVSPARIGIDIEKIRPCSKAIFKKTALQNEWNLSDEDPEQLFFRYWTAKEAVIKANGTGLKDLLKCSVTKIINKNNLVIDYMNKNWLIEHLFFNGHIASVIKNSKAVEWVL
jgi:4'-phosphopantetheinyl transferase